MSQSRNLATLGLPAVLALNINGQGATGITAAGATQATATVLQADVNVVSTAAAATGVILQALNQGDWIVVRNNGANAVLIYPPVGGTINALASNAGYSVAAGASGLVFCANATTFIGITAA